MSQQGPLLLVSNHGRPAFATALDEAQMFPLIETDFADGAEFAALAEQISARSPYLPLIAVNAEGTLPENAIPFFASDGKFDRLPLRLRAALRIRALHTTVLRRLSEEPTSHLPDID